MARLSLLTDRNAVEKAIREYDGIGAEAFLQRYGFRPARNYLLEINGKRYDSKAIVGAAFRYQTGKALAAKEFSGGEKTVRRALERLGFTVVPRHGVHPLQAFEVNKVYNRRRDIHGPYGGQQQGGISTPEAASVIFLFTGTSGERYGHKDHWTEDGVFLYTGEGQRGDMRFVAGNKAIRDHVRDGKDLLLFDELPKGGHRYMGAFSCASWHAVTAQDVEGRPRQAIVFHLVPCMELPTENEREGDQDEPLRHVNLAELRRKAMDAARPLARKVQGAAASYRERSEAVRAYVLARANGICEACGRNAPFIRHSGSPYLEPHHILRLADDGPDDPRFVAAICPTCHRRIHHGRDGSEINKRLRQTVLDLESEENEPRELAIS